MTLRSSSVLVLDDAGLPAALQSDRSPVVVHRAHGLLQAAALLAREHPLALVINPARAWHRRVARTIPPHLRPAILAVGPPGPGAELVDAWLDPRLPAAEFGARLQELATGAAACGPLPGRLTGAHAA